ncbi:AraC family transcriptional regulator [Marinomonas agarivorans]|nr:AraC family transcriptional regulator [Marinomonas agarivorans]
MKWSPFRSKRTRNSVLFYERLFMEVIYWALATVCFALAGILFWQKVVTSRCLAYYMLFFAAYLGLIILDAQAFYISPILYFLLLPIIFLPGPLLLGCLGTISTRKLTHFRDFIPCLLPIIMVIIAPEQISDRGVFELATQADYQKRNYISLFNLLSAIAGLQMLTYFIAAFWLIFRLKKDWQSYQSNPLPNSWFRMLQVISAIIVVTFLQVTSAFMNPSGNEVSIGDLSFIFITVFFIYQSVLTIYNNIHKKELVLIQHPLSYGAVKDEYEKDELSSLGVLLKNRIVTERLFLEADLSLALLAKKLDITSHKLSQVINTEFKQNFYLFINELRSQYAAEELSNKPEKSIVAVQFDAGFTTKSTFYSHFKKRHGCTPTQYRKKLMGTVKD